MRAWLFGYKILIFLGDACSSCATLVMGGEKSDLRAIVAAWLTEDRATRRTSPVEWSAQTA